MARLYSGGWPDESILDLLPTGCTIKKRDNLETSTSTFFHVVSHLLVIFPTSMLRGIEANGFKMIEHLHILDLLSYSATHGHHGIHQRVHGAQAAGIQIGTGDLLTRLHLEFILVQ